MFMSSDWEVAELAKGNMHVLQTTESRDEVIRKLALEVRVFRELISGLKKGLGIDETN